VSGTRVSCSDSDVHIETDSFEIRCARVSPAEHEEAAKLYAETGCVPLAYVAKVSNGYLRIKGSPW